jgi:hypothetical protein
MLVFNRPSFRSGIMVIRVTVESVEYARILRPNDRGDTIDFGADPVRDAVLAKYPNFFAMPA